MVEVLVRRAAAPQRQRTWAARVAANPMSKYRKPFLSLLSRLWAERLPSWKPGVDAPVSWARKDSTFSNVDAPDGRVFHVVIDFSSKWPGVFTADIVVADSLETLLDPVPRLWPDDIPALRTGSYRIGWFVAGRDIWWRLVDDEADLVGLGRYPDHWYADSYEPPLTVTMQKAAEHFSDTFEGHVLPRLKR